MNSSVRLWGATGKLVKSYNVSPRSDNQRNNKGDFLKQNQLIFVFSTCTLFFSRTAFLCVKTLPSFLLTTFIFSILFIFSIYIKFPEDKTFLCGFHPFQYFPIEFPAIMILTTSYQFFELTVFLFCQDSCNIPAKELNLNSDEKKYFCVRYLIAI